MVHEDTGSGGDCGDDCEDNGGAGDNGGGPGGGGGNFGGDANGGGDSGGGDFVGDRIRYGSLLNTVCQFNFLVFLLETSLPNVK